MPTYMLGPTVSAHGIHALSTTLLLAAIAGCDPPRFHGPQVQGVPSGFLRNPGAGRDRDMFPDRPAIHVDAWVDAMFGQFSGIYITGYPGNMSRAEVEEARERSMNVPTARRMSYGDLEEGRVDGQTAWAWMEVWEDNGLHEVAYRSVIPYDTVTYVVDFITDDPKFKSRSDSIRAIVSTFAIGRIEWNVPLVAGALGFVGLLLGSGWKKMQRRPYEDMRSMTLMTIPVEESDDDPQEAPPPLPQSS